MSRVLLRNAAVTNYNPVGIDQDRFVANVSRVLLNRFRPVALT